MAIGWICTIIASTVYWLYVSRFFLGVGSGITWGSLTIYLGEIAHPSIRGALVSKIRIIFSRKYNSKNKTKIQLSVK